MEEEAVTLSHGGTLGSLTVLKDGRLASAGGDGKVKIWPKEGMGRPVVRFIRRLDRDRWQCSSDGRLVSGGGDGKIKLWPKEGINEPELLRQGSPVVSLTVLPRRTLLASRPMAMGKIKLWPKDRI